MFIVLNDLAPRPNLMLGSKLEILRDDSRKHFSSSNIYEFRDSQKEGPLF